MGKLIRRMGDLPLQIVLEAKHIINQLGIEYSRFELFLDKEARRAQIVKEEQPRIQPKPQPGMDKLVGKQAKYDIFSETGVLLVAARTVLTRFHLQLLRMHNVTSIPVMPDEHKSAAAALLQEATRYAEDLFYRIRTNRQIPMLEIRSNLIPFIHQAAEHDDLFQIIEAVRSKDAYTYKHSVGVGVLASLIGKWMGLDASEQSLVATAATLHDVGKMKVSQELLQKPGKLTDIEYAEMKRHTVYGYEMLKETAGLNRRIALVALQHHERADGSGYPLKLHGMQTDPLSKIVAVADVFHAMTSDRPYQQALPLQSVLEQMRKCTFHGLDPVIVDVLLRHVGRNMLGKQALLNDGRLGEVVHVNPHDIFRPLVQVKQSFLDLSQENNLYIKAIIA
jgi:putative nucleotidyltransferase with HDIG domain